MRSAYLSSLTTEERDTLVLKLWESQHGLCFIDEMPIDLLLHKGSLDIDHIEPLVNGGKDDPSNFALTHESCNRFKQASDLRVARVLSRFGKIKAECNKENRGPNLSDVLGTYGGSKYDLNLSINGNVVNYSFPEIGDNQIYTSQLYSDDLTGDRYFFSKLPIAYLFHDDRVNPRSIGSSISGLVEEFFKKRPQLHVCLGWTKLDGNNGKCHLGIFDGQHKAVAQVLLDVEKIPVRIFLNPDLDVLVTTNMNAGTVLRQVAIDKASRRHLGRSLFNERIERYCADLNLNSETLDFSERDLAKHFKGETKEMKRYILDAVRDSITHSAENRLMDYVDFGGRAKEKPLSYSTIEKTFYSFFIYQDLLETPIDFRIEEGENPRELEKEQIVKLMNIIAEEIYIGRFDPSKGTNQIEYKIRKGESMPIDHLRAYRLSKEEVIYNWLSYIEQIVKNYFITIGIPISEKKLFQYKFPPQLWENIRKFLRTLRLLPVWVNTELSLSVFGGKQNYDYWQAIFETGKTPNSQQVLVEPLNLMEMIR